MSEIRDPDRSPTSQYSSKSTDKKARYKALLANLDPKMRSAMEKLTKLLNKK